MNNMRKIVFGAVLGLSSALSASQQQVKVEHNQFSRGLVQLITAIKENNATRAETLWVEARSSDTALWGFMLSIKISNFRKACSLIADAMEATKDDVPCQISLQKQFASIHHAFDTGVGMGSEVRSLDDVQTQPSALVEWVTMVKTSKEKEAGALLAKALQDRATDQTNDLLKFLHAMASNNLQEVCDFLGDAFEKTKGIWQKPNPNVEKKTAEENWEGGRTKKIYDDLRPIDREFIAAVRSCNVYEVARCLQNTSVNVNVKIEGLPAISWAANCDTTGEITQLLIKAHADIEAKDCSEETPLFRAILNETTFPFDILVNAGASVQAIKSWCNYTLLHEAAQFGKEIFIEKLLKLGVDVNALTKQNETALLKAVIFNPHLKIVEVLLRNGAGVLIDVQETLYGNTVLIRSAYNGYGTIVQVLLENGANPTIKNKEGHNAAIVARSKGYPEVAMCIETAIARWEAREKNVARGSDQP